MAAGEAGQEAAGRVVPWLARGESMGAAQEGTAESSLAFSGSFNRSGVKGKAVKAEQPGLPGRVSSKR